MLVHLSYKCGILFVGMDLLDVYKASMPSAVSYRVELFEETLFAFCVLLLQIMHSAQPLKVSVKWP